MTHTSKPGMTVCLSMDVCNQDLNILYIGHHTLPMTHQELTKLYHLLHTSLFRMGGYDKQGEYVMLVEKRQ